MKWIPINILLGTDFLYKRLLGHGFDCTFVNPFIYDWVTKDKLVMAKQHNYYMITWHFKVIVRLALQNVQETIYI